MKIICLLLFSLNCLNLIDCQMQCRDESGKIVDWYVMYKFPRLAKGKSPVDTGLRYAYITSNSKSGWTLSEQQIDDKKSIFGQTLQPLYSSKSDSKISYINYNDEPPEGPTKGTGAHAKGVVGADSTEGFWLIHSVPHFEDSSHTYVYPSTGGRYGQTGLCISFKLAEMDKIIDQLLDMQPNIYSFKASADLKNKFPKVKDLDNSDWISDKMSVNSITSSGGMNFTSFSKSPADHVDLYADIVAPKLKTSLYVETWRKNPGNPLPSVCDRTQTVQNVEEIAFKFDNSDKSGSFGYKDDHSKWALSTSASHPYLCVGDINRMESQYKRGGGTTCFQTAQVWKHWDEWIGKVDKCGK